jgi:hypothetical protein
MNESHVLSRHIFYVSVIIAILVGLLNVAMTVTVGALGYSGFSADAPITAVCVSYWGAKFADIQTTLKTAFIHLIISTVASIILVVILINLVMKLRNM